MIFIGSRIFCATNSTRFICGIICWVVLVIVNRHLFSSINVCFSTRFYWNKRDRTVVRMTHANSCTHTQGERLRVDSKKPNLFVASDYIQFVINHSSKRLMDVLVSLSIELPIDFVARAICELMLLFRFDWCVFFRILPPLERFKGAWWVQTKV